MSLVNPNSQLKPVSAESAAVLTYRLSYLSRYWPAARHVWGRDRWQDGPLRTGAGEEANTWVTNFKMFRPIIFRGAFPSGDSRRQCRHLIASLSFVPSSIIVNIKFKSTRNTRQDCVNAAFYQHWCDMQNRILTETGNSQLRGLLLWYNFSIHPLPGQTKICDTLMLFTAFATLQTAFHPPRKHRTLAL